MLRILHAASFLIAVVFSLLAAKIAPLHASSCYPSNNPYAGPNIGFQYVANGCTSQGRTIYSRYDLNCLNGTVQAIDQQMGQTPRTPDEMQNWITGYFNWMVDNGYLGAYYRDNLKLFRSDTGSSFVLVMGSYATISGSHIDGKILNSFPYWPTFNPIDFGAFDYPSGQTPPCCLSITSAATDLPSFKPSLGETTTITANISSNYPITWTLTLNGSTITGSGSVSHQWDGRKGEFPVAPGVYNAEITATSASCTANATIPVTVVGTPGRICMIVPFGSGANVATGNLSFSQDVFSVQGGVFPLGFSLSYNSLDTTAGPLGPGWRHAYEISLQNSGNGGKVLAEGDTRRVYTWNGSTYQSETGDTSVLAKNGATHELIFTDGRKYYFLADGTLDRSTDKYNNVLSFGYSGADLTTVSDGIRSVTLEYDVSVTPHSLTGVTDPNNNFFTFEYQNNLLWKVVNPVTDAGEPAGYWEYSYQVAGNLLKSKKDPAGNVIQYDYYTDNRVKSSLDPNQKPRAMVYPSSGGSVRTTTFTEKDGGQWLYTYDIRTGFLMEKTPVGGKKTSYYYNSDATLRAKTEPFDTNYLTTFFTYDGVGNLLTETDPVDISTYSPVIDPQTVDIAGLASLTPPIGTALLYTYDPANFHQIASLTDERFSPSRTTSYQYTTENGFKVTTVTDAEGKQTITRHNANGTIAEVEDGNQKKTTYAYFPDTPENRNAGVVGLLQSVTTPDNVVTGYTGYDKNGNPLEIKVRDTAKRELRTVQTFDALNRLRSVTRFAANLPENVTLYRYDNNGNLASVIDPELKETLYLHNYQGQVTRVIDARMKETAYEYGSVGCPSCSGVDKLTSVTDARLKKTTYSYNTLGHLERETDPLSKVFRYTYYDNGLVKEKIDATTPSAETTLVTHFYDTHGRLTKKRYADGSETAFTYYPDGALWTAANQNISYTYTYYRNGWLKSVTDSLNRVITYDEYDNIGRRKSVTFFPGTPDARSVTYHYDNANRLDTITSPAGPFTIGYDTLSRKQTVTFPNGITADHGYDDLDRLTGLTHRTADDAVIAQHGYTHYPSGNRQARTGTVNETYLYDDVYRLTRAVTAGGTENYDYDDVGNRLTGPGPKNTGYTYDDGNRMTTGRIFSYLYDNRGNQAQRIINNAPDKSWLLSWDHENRLIGVEKSKGSGEKRTTTFKYDPLGRRIEKRHVTLKNGITGTTTTSYVYDGDSIILETVDDGATTKTFYTHGPGIDEPLAMERNGQYYYYHADGLGSVTAITDVSGNVVQSYGYDSFGMPRPTTNFRNSYQFTAREWDRETRLYYYRARYYDPMEGRFISKDPIGFDGGINVYAYVQNNPVNKIDPTGNISIQIGTVIIVVTVATAAKFCYDMYKCFKAIDKARTKVAILNAKYPEIYMTDQKYKEFMESIEYKEILDRCPSVAVASYTTP